VSELFTVVSNADVCYMQNKVREKEVELETKFDSRLRQLQSLQQMLIEKLSASEQRAATLQFGMFTLNNCSLALMALLLNPELFCVLKKLISTFAS